MGRAILMTTILMMMCRAATAERSPEIRDGSPVRVVLGARRLPGTGLRACADGWSLTLAHVAVGAFAELTDVTPGEPFSQLLVPIADGALRLDGQRFRATHIYRLQIVGDSTLRGSALVYLYPKRAR
jgi:hypothetical protein